MADLAAIGQKEHARPSAGLNESLSEARLTGQPMRRRTLAPIVALFVAGCTASPRYSQPGVHPYSDLPASHEQPPNDEPPAARATPSEPQVRGTEPRSQAEEATKKREQDPLRQQCKETREAREKDRLQALEALDQYHADQERVMPWFNQHCHLVEVKVTRKVGDRFESKPEPVMQCDTDAGRPKGLTEQFVAEHQAAITTPDTFYHQDLRELHRSCAPYDEQEQPE
jgi:hypothetical protein